VALSGCQCGETEIYIREKEPEQLRKGEACVVDSECETGRCVAGICEDGACGNDDDCRADHGEICVLGECVPGDEFACTGDQQPLISVTPSSVEFGEVTLGGSASETLTITNVGDCMLSVSGVGFADNTDPGFTCEPCAVSEYPRRLPPQRDYEVVVTYEPPGPGAALSVLEIVSDDETAGDNGLVEIPLSAVYSGEPRLVLEPSEVNFGYVSYTAGGGGSSSSETVRVTNQGSGNAALIIEHVFVTPGMDFSIPDELVAVSPANPLTLPPYDANDPDTWIDVEITFEPTRNFNAEAELSVSAHAGDPAAGVIRTALLHASSLGPPVMTVTPLELVFRDDNGDPIDVGMVGYKQVTISNSGQSDLVVDLVLNDTSGDFSISPGFVPPIAPGGQVVLSVFYNPSQPSDPIPANANDPQSSIDAFLQVTSNDTANTLETVTLRGWAKGGTFDDILKLEMTYENADNSWAGSDYRDVNLELESPIGYTCSKPSYTYVDNGSGGYVVDPNATIDYCEQWNTTGLEGTVSWIALGQYEEPERILLHGLGQTLANGQDFTVRAHYIEDCANIPSGILADLLGIGGSILLGYLGGSIGVPISVPPDQISDMISENCWDRDSSQVTVKIFINGTEVAAPQVRLNSKGDFADVATIRRQDGQFVLQP
jgi:hypothetical protein